MTYAIVIPDGAADEPQDDRKGIVKSVAEIRVALADAMMEEREKDE